jgi:hypothetical protein
MATQKSANRYSQLIEAIFLKHYQEGMDDVAFDRIEITATADELGIALPKNVGDVLYSFRYRVPLPTSIVEKAPEGFEWIIRPAGRALYRFVLVRQSNIAPSSILAETKILDATPGAIARYALSDEQALLAIVRDNRLADIFTSIVCYSLQNHLRTTVRAMGQVGTDEIYIGIDKRGAHYVLPVQAKGRTDRIGIVQIEQDMAVCQAKFPDLICRPLAAQFMQNGVIAMFEFEQGEDGIRVSSERHYRLVRPDELSAEELVNYRSRLSDV